MECCAVQQTGSSTKSALKCSLFFADLCYELNSNRYSLGEQEHRTLPQAERVGFWQGPTHIAFSAGARTRFGMLCVRLCSTKTMVTKLHTTCSLVVSGSNANKPDQKQWCHNTNVYQTNNCCQRDLRPSWVITGDSTFSYTVRQFDDPLRLGCL